MNTVSLSHELAASMFTFVQSQLSEVRRFKGHNI